MLDRRHESSGPTRRKTETEKARDAFVANRTDSWQAGGCGCTVHVWAERGSLKIRWTKPKRRQNTDFHEDTRENRRALVEIATSLVAKIKDPTRSRHPRTNGKVIRWRDVWLGYLRARWPNLPDRVIRGGCKEVREYYANLPGNVRRRVPSPRYLLSTLHEGLGVRHVRARRRRHRRRARVDWERYTLWRLAQPVPGRSGQYYAPSAVETDYRRLHAALQHAITRRPASWGDRRDPLAGVSVDKPERKQVPELGEDGARDLLAALRKDLRRRWRAWAALAIGMETGRRISEIGPDTLGFDGDPLCANDFRRGSDGRLYVTFSAASLKGRNYGRGDLTFPATRGLEVAYRFLRRYHPNPHGSDAPLIWSPQDPRVPVSYTAFVDAWRATHDGQDPPRGMKFHSVCYTAITTLVEAVGLERTAEFVGRSTQTIERIYKRVRQPTQIRTADALDAVRGHDRRRRAAGVPA